MSRPALYIASAEGRWTVAEVAAYLKMSKKWVYRAAAAGEIPCRKLGGALRFDPEEIRTWWAAPSKDRVIPIRSDTP